jgi:hypothetical protein
MSLLTDIQSDEQIPAQYDMTPEEWAEFQREYNDWANVVEKQHQDPLEDRPIYLWLT